MDEFLARTRDLFREHPWFAGVLTLAVMFGAYLGGIVGDWLMN